MLSSSRNLDYIRDAIARPAINAINYFSTRTAIIAEFFFLGDADPWVDFGSPRMFLVLARVTENFSYNERKSIR